MGLLVDVLEKSWRKCLEVIALVDVLEDRLIVGCMCVESVGLSGDVWSGVEWSVVSKMEHRVVASTMTKRTAWRTA
jgi:hypothetical protein